MELELNIVEILMSSGLVVKGVLLLLVLASVLTWSIVLMKIFAFKKVQKLNTKFRDFFGREEDWKVIKEVAHTYSGSTFCYLFLSAFDELEKLQEKLNVNEINQTKDYFGQRGFHLIKRSLEKSFKEASLSLESALPLLASIGSTALFVGLFGTVWGIINSFSGLAAGGASSIDAVAPGIAEALVATAIGLGAAIPAVWFFNSLNTRVSKIYDEMSIFEKEMMNQLEKKVFI